MPEIKKHKQCRLRRIVPSLYRDCIRFPVIPPHDAENVPSGSPEKRRRGAFDLYGGMLLPPADGSLLVQWLPSAVLMPGQDTHRAAVRNPVPENNISLISARFNAETRPFRRFSRPERRFLPAGQKAGSYFAGETVPAASGRMIFRW